MESQGIHGHPEQSKTTKAAHFPPISLPEELIREILLKLPVESLCKLKSVSKSWLSLISSPDFVKAHLLLSTTNKDYTHHRLMFTCDDTVSCYVVKDCSLSSLFSNSVTDAFDLDYPGKNPIYCPVLVGSSNGLVCLAIRLVDDGLYGLFLWNPSLRMYKKLPNFGLNLKYPYYCNNVFRFGFAYDELQDDYKVVGIFPIYENDQLHRVEVKIYSLRSDSWKRASDFQGREFNSSGKLVNGNLHWVEYGWNIISFDLTEEKWSEIKKPCDFIDFMVLAVFEGNLSVVFNYSLSDTHIWVMKGYGIKESWTKMFTITSPNYFWYGDTFGPPILLSNEGEIFLLDGSRFAIYNPKDGSSRYLDVTNLAEHLEAEVYVKSLVCPFSLKGP